jgi:sec-independent protein translocase protein TatA
MHLGVTEIIAIFLIILLLFGPGRIEKLASEMGRGIRSFREGLQSDKKKKAKAVGEEDEAEEEPKVAAAPKKKSKK